MTGPSDELLDTLETAGLLRTTQAALADQRYRGIGPTYLKVGRKVLYRRRDLDAWLRTCERKAS